MTLTFETTIKETNGALNTAAKIADILKNSEVTFGILESSKVPGIWVKLPDVEKSKFVAHHNQGNPEDEQFCEKYEGENVWWTAYAKNPFSYWGHELYLFSHLTDAAEKLVQNWIIELCAEYDRRIKNDTL